MTSTTAFPVGPKWSDAEKKIARKAYDRAFERQCTAITQKAKQMLATTSPPYGVWEVHDHLTRERKKVDRTYDYRYTVLISVFAALRRDGWSDQADLIGLHPDKIKLIEDWAKG